jgi:hypothetical protein
MERGLANLAAALRDAEVAAAAACILVARSTAHGAEDDGRLADPGPIRARVERD